MPAPTITRCPSCGGIASPSDRFCSLCGASIRPSGESADGDSSVGSEHRPRVDRILEALRAATIGDYDIADELGRGGMAVVFLAHDLHLNRKVAIKALLPELLFTEGMDRRFKQEARVAAKLDHPNILVIYGVRESKDLLYIVMKLVDGLPLSAILKREGALPLPVARLVIRQVSEALHYAHGEGVVHRDIKPANVMVDRKGNIVVMDFGIAKAADDVNLTRTGLVIGTPAYMSPEQCLSHRVTAASDQYALGTVAYELLTGHVPFRGSQLEMQWAHTASAPKPVREARRDCPADLEAIVMRMLAKKPEERWPSLHEVAESLADDVRTESAARQVLASMVNATPPATLRPLPATPASPVPQVALLPTEPAVGDASPVTAPRTVPTLLRGSLDRVELEEGDSTELSVTILDASGQTVDLPVAWTSSDPAVVTVADNGRITAESPGAAEVTATTTGLSAVCAVRVMPARVATLEIEPGEATVFVGDRVAFTASGLSRFDRRIPSPPVRWTSHRKSIASIDPKGVAVGRAAGSTEITAAHEAIEARARVMVNALPVAAVTVNPATLTLRPGKEARVKATPVDRAGNALTERSFHWRSHDVSVATVHDGRIRAQGPGETVVEVSCEDATCTVSVGVVAIPPKPPKPKKTESPNEKRRRSFVGVIAGSALTVALGIAGIVMMNRPAGDRSDPGDRRDSGAVGRTANPPATTPATQSTPTPTATAPVVVPPPPVSPPSTESGQPKTVATVPAEAATRVTAPPVARVEISPAGSTLERGDSVRLEARLLDPGSSRRISIRPTWRSTRPDVAAVSATGLVRALSPGSADVVASVGEARQSIAVRVTERLVAGVVIDPPTSRPVAGETMQLRARALDKTSMPVPNARLTYRSAAPEVATVDDRGLVTTHAAGRAAIIAAAEGRADTAAFDVAPRVSETPRLPEPRVAEVRPDPVPPPTTPARRDSTAPNVASPTLSRDDALGLFKPLTDALVARSAERIEAGFPAPSNTEDARLRRDFIRFVRDASPRATVRGIVLQSPTADGTPATLTVDMSWRNNAGIRNDRPAEFTAVATAVNGQWQLRNVRLVRKFW